MEEENKKTINRIRKEADIEKSKAVKDVLVDALTRVVKYNKTNKGGAIPEGAIPMDDKYVKHYLNYKKGTDIMRDDMLNYIKEVEDANFEGAFAKKFITERIDEADITAKKAGKPRKDLVVDFTL